MEGTPPKTVDEVFNDFKGRRAGLIKALTARTWELKANMEPDQKRKKTNIKEQFGIDLISELPEHMIEIILRKLPIVEAVRTSILSTGWRHKWASLRHVVIDDRSLTMFNGQKVVKVGISNFITKFSSPYERQHIHRFSVSSLYLWNSTDIDHWIQSVSEKDVKDLVVELEQKSDWLRAPLCAFSCKTLSHLELVRCELKLPPNFKGFSCLKVLKLDHVRISSNDVQKFISSCPLLESLALVFPYLSDDLALTIRDRFFHCLELAIHAPNLKHLAIEGTFNNLSLAHTPLLVDILVKMYNLEDLEDGAAWNNFFGDARKIERLSGMYFFVQYLCMGRNYECSTELRCSELPFGHLKFIELDDISFNCLHEVQVVLQLLLDSPNLEDLHLTASSGSLPDPDDLVFWDEYISKFPMLHQLKTVKFVAIELKDERFALKFIELLLGHSPALEEMRIEAPAGPYLMEERMKFLNEVLRFRRASTRASIHSAQFPQMLLCLKEIQVVRVDLVS